MSTSGFQLAVIAGFSPIKIIEKTKFVLANCPGEEEQHPIAEILLLDF
jgi:hypothetical protein